MEIAQGGDGYNTWWDDEFAPVMKQIEEYIDAIEVYQLELNWKEICDTVPALHGKAWDISKDHASIAFFGESRILDGLQSGRLGMARRDDWPERKYV
jgi:hypothetical protein